MALSCGESVIEIWLIGSLTSRWDPEESHVGSLS
jgi:hypothetical protein